MELRHWRGAPTASRADIGARTPTATPYEGRRSACGPRSWRPSATSTPNPATTPPSTFLISGRTPRRSPIQPERWDYYELCAAHDDRGHTEELLAELKAELTPSLEYGATLVRALETGEPSVIYGNVPNRGVIANLPEGCCVEVTLPGRRNGIHPFAVGAAAASVRGTEPGNVNVQELAVDAALPGTRACLPRDHARPPHGAVLTLAQIRSMTDELLAAEREWLPEFARK